MPWISKAPRSVVDLDHAASLFETNPPQVVVKAYRDIVLENDGEIPKKSGLDVTRFVSALPFVAMYALQKPDKAIYRLAGEEWIRRIGMNPVGKNYFDFVPEERRSSAAFATFSMIDLPYGYRMLVEQVYEERRNATVEILALPLLSTEPGIDGFSLLASDIVKPHKFSPIPPRDSGISLGANVLERDLIDLGFGVPDSFEELVKV